MKLRHALTFIALLVAPSLRAQNLTGSWQTTVGNKTEHHRMILQVKSDRDGELAASLYLIDDSPDGLPIHTITQNGSQLAFAVPELKINYKGILSADGKSVAGILNWEGKGPITFARATTETSWPHDVNCACSLSFVSVDKGTKLEVLDWGGTGRPVILLAGLGDTAHVFDDFAHKLAARYHVYGITRRGFGDSTQSLPTEANYDANRLGDDVVGVIDALHLAQRPVLIGHSIAGEELSSVGSRHPEKIAGLIYLEAGYEYALYDRMHQNDFDIDMLEVRKNLEELVLRDSDRSKTIAGLLAKLPELEKELDSEQKRIAGIPRDAPDSEGAFGAEQAVRLGERRYTGIKVPVLAIFANPHALGTMNGLSVAQRDAMTHYMSEHTTTFLHAFETEVPGAQVVSIPNADHYIFKSNAAEVLKDIDHFIGVLSEAD